MTMAARRGMTLMELVIGLAITGMMAAGGAGAFASIVSHREIVRTASLTTERAAALRDMIHVWISAGTVQIPRGGGPRWRADRPYHVALEDRKRVFHSAQGAVSEEELGFYMTGGRGATANAGVRGEDEHAWDAQRRDVSRLRPRVRFRRGKPPGYDH